MQENATPAKVQTSREQVKTCSLPLCFKIDIDDLTTPAFWPVVVFSYHFRRFPVVGGKQNRGNRGS